MPPIRTGRTAGPATAPASQPDPAARRPPGYGVTMAATVAATTLAAVLAALIARRDALVAIPVSLGIWAITGLSVVEAGLQLGHTGLTQWGIILVVASVTGAAAGMLLAARRGRASRSSPGAAELSPHTQPSPAVPATPGPDAT